MAPLSPEDSFERLDSSPGAQDFSFSAGSNGGSNGDLSRKRSRYSTLVDRATHVLRVEARALAHIAHFYETDEGARTGLADAVDAILTAHQRGGKVVVCGVGKSAYIGMKAVATFKSLGIGASFMHGCEAAHGDLGDIRPGRDVLLFVSFSGRTPELLNLLPHIPLDVRLMALTAHHVVAKCPLLMGRADSVLLPTPIPEPEQETFGVCAPSTSTTVTLALCDMLVLTVADELHGNKTKQIFGRHHPGGAIGVTYRQVEQEMKKTEVELTVVEMPSPSISAESAD